MKFVLRNDYFVFAGSVEVRTVSATLGEICENGQAQIQAGKGAGGGGGAHWATRPFRFAHV